MNAFMNGKATPVLRRASLFSGALALIGTLALLMYAPEGNAALNGSLTVLALGSLGVHIFTCDQPRASVGVSLLLFFCSLNLLIPHFSAGQASQNLNGRASAATQQASLILRDNPLNIWKAYLAIRPLAWRDSSYSTADVEVFRKAQAMGIQSEEIRRVLANGFVQGEDRKLFIHTLIRAQENATPGAGGLLAKLAM